MRDDLRIRILDRRKHALSHRRAVDIEVGVDRANHHVQLRKDFVGVVERSVFEDVHFSTGQDADAQILFVGGVDFFDVRRHALFVQPVGDCNRFRMVRNCNVLVAKVLGRFRHFFDRVLPVAGRAVHLQVALHVFQRDQMRQHVMFGGSDLAGVFAQLRRDEIQFQFRIDLFFGASGDALFPLQRRQRIFVER